MRSVSFARRAALVAAFFIAPAWSSATVVRATVVQVLDGDTVKVRVPAWRETPFEVLSVRVLGIDTPETHAALAKCPLELERGKAAPRPSPRR
jgi:endonuclease YncB( thermonuclease family)